MKNKYLLPWRINVYQSHIGIVDADGYSILSMTPTEALEKAQFIIEAVNKSKK